MNPGLMLIIEDDISLGRLFQTQLLPLWPDATTDYMLTWSLHEAQHILTQVTPDIVLLDLMLPDSAGMDTLDAIVATLPTEVPIVAISGHLTMLEGIQALHHGATSFLLKGACVTAAALQYTLACAWARSHGHRRRRQDACAPSGP